jgi:hypothetical protein
MPATTMRQSGRSARLRSPKPLEITD